MESRRKSRRSSAAVAAGRAGPERRGDLDKGSNVGCQEAARRARGLGMIVARGGRPAGAAGDPLGDLAGHPAPPFATADSSVFPSGNHLVRFRVRVPGLADRSGVASHGSFDGHPWPWLLVNVLRCQMANLHSLLVTGSKAGDRFVRERLINPKWTLRPIRCLGGRMAFSLFFAGRWGTSLARSLPRRR